jgi:phosphotriesterase-related protein
MGTNSPITANEKKCLRAASIAQEKSGIGLNVHVHPWRREAPEAARIALEAGADPGRTVISHLDGILDLDYHIGIAELGVFLEFDIFGAEYYWDYQEFYLPSDRERVLHIIELVRRGYLDQILISHDICYKTKLTRYGGWGYAHILEHVVPMFSRFGLDDDEIKAIIEDNPRRWLTGE